jgi:Dolichyl-phosphate-mannose-protein mannosyltransferase
MSPRREAALLVAAILIQAGLSILAMRGNSATFDEGAHLPAGYTHLVLGDHRLNPEQPPLVKLLAAVPLLFVHPVVDVDDRAWVEGRQWEFGQRFLYRWNDADRLLFLGRLPVVALASCLLAAVYFEARRRFGPVPAAAALFLAALSPDVLAHGALVTTDLGFALFFFLAVAAFTRLIERGTPRRLLAAGLAAGAAFATKFSAPILVPALIVLGVMAALDGRPMERAIAGPARPIVGPGPRLRQVALVLLALGGISLVCIWGSYGFRYALSRDPEVRATQRVPLERPGGSLEMDAVVAAARARIVPEDYARGLLFVLAHSEARPTFLLGRLSDRGFPEYFVLTFLLKTPVPLLLLALLAAARALRLPRRDAAFLWVPVLVYVAFTATRGLQIGHRHLLPVYPFLFVAAGEGAACLVAWRRPLGLGLALALGGWYAGGTLRTHPHHLAYFNEIAGGPANGWRILVDSNLDWGQDLKRLAAWMRQNRVDRLKLSYFGSALPSYYGIDAEALPGYTAPHVARVTREVRPGDVVAISATNLQGVYLEPEDRALMERFRRLSPIARVGFSIFVYRADFSWPETLPRREEP